jgi:hypothetical protein
MMLNLIGCETLTAVEEELVCPLVVNIVSADADWADTSQIMPQT